MGAAGERGGVMGTVVQIISTELLSRGEAGGVLYNVYVYVCSAEREAQVLNPEGAWELQT